MASKAQLRRRAMELFGRQLCLSCSLQRVEPIMWRAKCHSRRHAQIGERRYMEFYSAESKKDMPRNLIGR